MLNRVELKNFGPIAQLDWSSLGKINLVIGGNGSGKTFLLKALYSATRTLEEFKRGNEQRSAAEILANKLRWTFQSEKIGDLVTKGIDERLNCRITFDKRVFKYEFGEKTIKQISILTNNVLPRESNSIFLPSKEVLSLHHIILKSREQDKVFGFDDTYLDLARALRQSTIKGKNYSEFAKSRKSLEDIIGGKVVFDEGLGSWQFKNRNNQKFQIGVTAEGIKKIAILDTLLGNRYLTRNSIIFIDEPESALHPVAISKLLDIIAMLAERGIQFFLASHSYFVVKKLFLIAQEKNFSIPVISATEISATEVEWQVDDLLDGMPDNPIISESIRLYREEVGMVLR